MSQPMENSGGGVGAWGAGRAVLLLIILGTVLRVVLGGALGLGVDESYAVSVARGLGLSYFDHPPISFWIPGVLARLAHSESGLLMRLPFILLFAGTTWLLYRLTSRLFGERAGLFAALLLTVSPVFSLSTGGWVLPDGPLMFFMLAAALCLERVLLHDDEAHPTSWWAAAGVFTGLALLSKYHGIFIAAGAFLFLLTRRESRHWLRHPGPYLAAGIAAVMFLPVLYWNATHGWISFRFQGGRGVPAGLHVGSFLQSIAGQAGYLLPWIWVPVVWVLVRSLAAGPRDARRWLLCCLAIGPIVVFTLPSLGGNAGLPHWEAPGYLFAFPLLGAAADHWLRDGRRAVRGWLRFSVASFLALVAVAATQVTTGWLTDLAPSFRRGDPSWQVLDWRALRPALADRGLLTRDGRRARGALPDTTWFVAAPGWVELGKVAYALGPDVPAVCLCEHPHQFGYLDPQSSFLGRDAVIVLHTDDDAGAAARFAPYFRSVAPAGTVAIDRLGRPVLTLSVLLGRDFTRPVGANRDAARTVGSSPGRRAPAAQDATGSAP
ncbi:MAG: glycosyltransferase family 39 protein [Gemmatimonadota bacterium]